jgi:hypothetical protein
MHKKDVVRFERHYLKDTLWGGFSNKFSHYDNQKKLDFWEFFESVNSEILLKY